MANSYPDGALEGLQQIATDILAKIDTSCRENDIDYFIVGGTLLGSIRHGGFIPWDDDIDIAMPYDDFIRFVENADKILPEGYSCHTPFNTPGFSTLWAKVYKDGTRYITKPIQQAGCKQGIFVDVFPYIRLSKDEKEARKQIRGLSIAQKKLYLHYIAHPTMPINTRFKGLKQALCGLIHYTIARYWTPERIVKSIQPLIHTKNPGDMWVNTGYADWGSHKDSSLFPTKDLAFGEHTFKAPRVPEHYLEKVYGDYMTPPPLEERNYTLPLILDFGDGKNAME